MIDILFLARVTVLMKRLSRIDNWYDYNLMDELMIRLSETDYGIYAR